MREKRSLIVKWKFSTNRVIIKGSNGFDCIFGPGNETQAHATNEISQEPDLVTFPEKYPLFQKHMARM